MNEEEKIATVPFFIHEAVCDKMERANEAIVEVNNKALEKMDKSNKRMLTALVAVCITLIITVSFFLLAYKEMNNSWLNYIDKHSEEMKDGGLFEERDAGANSITLER